ncbi:MAG: ATP-binding cassette domain-containing protein [Acidiferrobacterales bacterium]
MSRLRIVKLLSHTVGPITLSIKPSECVCISGPSGAGKTVLLRAVADLDDHDGKVYLDRTECVSFSGPQWRRRVGLLPAESEWWDDRVAPHFDGIEDTALQDLGLDTKILDRAVTRLSTGERQRLALLRLLAQRPKVLLLDEPTASLDSKNVRRVERSVAAYRKAHKAPVLWVSHDLRQIRRVSTRHLRLLDGELSEGQMR